MTRVVHCRREPYDIYIGRPSHGDVLKELADGDCLGYAK